MDTVNAFGRRSSSPYKGVRAILRMVPETLRDALSLAGSAATIDIAAARRQHHWYAEALRANGVEVAILAPDDHYPDSAFVEDAAVVLDDVVVLARPGAPSRRGEPSLLERLFGERHIVARIRSPGTLDGGDVLRVGRRLFVGLSRRTNAAGAAQLAEVARPRGWAVSTTPVERVLHLKSAASALDEQTVLVAAAHVARESFAGLDVLEVAPTEAAAANVLRIPGTDTVLVREGARETSARVERLGLSCLEVDISELEKADGGLTCLSIVLGGQAHVRPGTTATDRPGMDVP